jgi:hypothetical protein
MWFCPIYEARVGWNFSICFRRLGVEVTNDLLPIQIPIQKSMTTTQQPLPTFSTANLPKGSRIPSWLLTIRAIVQPFDGNFLRMNISPLVAAVAAAWGWHLHYLR